MLSSSIAARKAVANNSKLSVRAKLTLADGSVVELGGDDVMMGGMSFSAAVSSSGSFDMGAAITGKLDVTLNNIDGRFDAFDFEGSVIEPSLGVPLAGGGTEWLRKGVFNVEQPSSYGNTVKLECLDNMVRFEKASELSWPASSMTLLQVVQAACEKADVRLASATFANASLVAAEFASDGSTTLRDVVSYAAQMSGNWARIDEWGALEIGWYDLAPFEGDDWLDGGLLDEGAESPYPSGDAADGGSFAWPSGDDLDGGAFTLRDFCVIDKVSSLALATDDVVVTGVRVKAKDGAEEDGETVLAGSEGYVIAVEANPLVPFGCAGEMAQALAARTVGMRFRPFSASCLGDPTVEPGDPAVLIDAKGRQYRSYVTSYCYKLGGYASAECGAESPRRNSAGGASAETKAYIEARKAAKEERTEREKAMEELTKKLADSEGLFSSQAVGSDGSTTYYMHDKPTLADSKVVWRINAGGIAVSTDGGETYATGLDASGDAILSRIYAIGIDADYITTGSLTVKDEDRVVFKADCDTGTVYMGTDNMVMVNSDAMRTMYLPSDTKWEGTCDSSPTSNVKVIKITKRGEHEFGTFSAVSQLLVKFKYWHDGSGVVFRIDGKNYPVGSLASGGKPIGAVQWGMEDSVLFTTDGVAQNDGFVQVAVTSLMFECNAQRVGMGCLTGGHALMVSGSNQSKSQAYFDNQHNYHLSALRNVALRAGAEMTLTAGALSVESGDGFSVSGGAVSAESLSVPEGGAIAAGPVSLSGDRLGLSVSDNLLVSGSVRCDGLSAADANGKFRAGLTASVAITCRYPAESGSDRLRTFEFVDGILVGIS